MFKLPRGKIIRRPAAPAEPDRKAKRKIRRYEKWRFY